MNHFLLAGTLCSVLVFSNYGPAASIQAAESDSKQLEWIEERITSDQERILSGISEEDAWNARVGTGYAIASLDADTAISLLKKYRKLDARNGDGLDFAYVEVAKACLKNKDYDRCKALLQEAILAYPAASMTGATMLAFGELAAAQRDFDGERKWLKRCLAIDATKESKHGLKIVASIRSDALFGLARNCEKAGSPVQAYVHWESWRPNSHCGQGYFAGLEYRDIAQRRCLAAMSEHKLIVRFCLAKATAGDETLARAFIVPLYRDAGQLNDLSRIAADLERLESKRPDANDDAGKRRLSVYLRDAIAAEKLRQQGDIDELLRQLKTGTNTAERIIAEALASSGDAGAAALQEALRIVSIHDRDELLQSLADNGSSTSFRVLFEFAESNEGVSNDYVLVNYVSEGGDEGIKALSSLARHSNSDRAIAARTKMEFLGEAGRAKFEEVARKQIADRRTITVLAHKLRPGSLPRCVDEALKVEVPTAKN